MRNKNSRLTSENEKLKKKVISLENDAKKKDKALNETRRDLSVGMSNRFIFLLYYNSTSSTEFNMDRLLNFEGQLRSVD